MPPPPPPTPQTNFFLAHASFLPPNPRSNPHPQTRRFFETFSYLPPLTNDQIAKQVDYIVNNNWTPCLVRFFCFLCFFVSPRPAAAVARARRRPAALCRRRLPPSLLLCPASGRGGERLPGGARARTLTALAPPCSFCRPRFCPRRRKKTPPSPTGTPKTKHNKNPQPPTTSQEFSNEGYVTNDSVVRLSGVAANYYDNRYWTMWKLPMFGCTDSSQVLREIEAATKAFPDAYIRMAAFDAVRQVQVASMLVHRPAAATDYRKPDQRQV